MESPVDLADQYSRRRAMFVAGATAVFLVIHVLVHPFQYARGARSLDWWLLNAVVLLVVLATGGGLLNRTAVRKLVNDEVSDANQRRAVLFGFWASLGVAIALYLWPAFASRSAREAIFVIVTTGTGTSMLLFAWLELRAHRNG